MRVRTQTVAPAGKVQLGAGTFFRMIACPNPVDIVFKRDGSPIAEFLQVGTGIAWESRDEAGELTPFTSVEITSAAAQSIQFGFGFGDLRYDVANGNVNILKSQNLSDTADVTIAAAATGTIAANTRRAIIIGSLAANTGNFRVGPNAAAGRGQELSPGMSITIESSAQIKVYNAGTANQTYTILEVLD